MICMYAHVIARVMCIYPLHCCDGGVCLHHDLPTMHAPWLSHCKSSWSCMNWKLGSKHLDVMHGVIPHPATIFASRRWSGKHLYGTEGTWINCPTCFPLLNVGFMAILRRTDCFVLIWTCIAVLADHRQRSFSKLSRLQNETHKNRNVVLFCCHVVSRNDVCWAAW